MTKSAGVGISRHRDPRKAGREAAQMALKAGGFEKPDFVFMFATVGYPQPVVLEAVRKETGQVPLCGCSGEGVITHGIADETNFAVVVMAIKSDDIKFRHGLATGLKSDSEAAGRQIAQSLKPHVGDDAVALFVLGDGLTINFDAVQRGIEAHIGRHIPVFGGVSADNWAFKQTYQYHDGQVVSDGIAWALMSGKARIISSVNHGCVPIGGKRKITRAKGNVIYEIDGRPALDVLKEYLLPEEIDNWDKAVISLCLGFKTPAHIEGYDEYMIRFIPSRDEAKGSISIQTEVRENGDIWMTRRDPEKMAAGVRDAARKMRAQAGVQKPKMVFQFDCCGRGKVILDEAMKLQLLKDLQSQIGPDAPWIGFYTLGEIGPVGKHNCFHNYTVVLAAVY
jgi:hypothetical protein